MRIVRRFAALRSFEALHVRNYRLYFVSQIVSFSGTMMQSVAQAWLMLKLTGSGTRYTGQDEWFRDSDCARRFSNDTVVNLLNGNQTAHLCSTGPFTDATPVSNCVDLNRILNFKQQ